MDFIEVDRDKCNQDSICIAACPSKLLYKNEEGFPVPVPDAGEMCIRCGHCVAICPTGALSHSRLKNHIFESLDDSLKLTGEQCEYFLKTRRSIRAYKDKPVSRDKLERLIDTAKYAPTARNSQGVRWLVVTGKEELRKYSGMVIDFFEIILKGEVSGISPNPHLKRIIDEQKAGTDHILRDAPCLVITYGSKENRLAQNDCVIALSWLELAATSIGLGCCWAGFFMTAAAHYSPLMEALLLPDGHQCFGAMMVGYPKFRYHKIPSKKEPKIIWR